MSFAPHRDFRRRSKPPPVRTAPITNFRTSGVRARVSNEDELASEGVCDPGLLFPDVLDRISQGGQEVDGAQLKREPLWNNKKTDGDSTYTDAMRSCSSSRPSLT